MFPVKTFKDRIWWGSLSYYFERECKKAYKMQIVLCFFEDVIYTETIQ